MVVPARNEETYIGACLESICLQDYSNMEILVVDGASEDRTAEIVREMGRQDGRIRLLTNPERAIPRSLNIAMMAAQGRWLVRVDAHATVPPHYVGRAVGHLRSGRWGGVGGRKDGVGVTAEGRAIAVAMGSPFGVGNSTYHHGTRQQPVDHVPFGAYPLDVVRELGGWNERLRVNQDFEFDYRVRASGRQLLFDPDLVIKWHCRQSILDLYRQYRRYGKGKAVVARLHPDSVRLRHLAAPGLVAAGTLAAAAAPRRPLWAAALVGLYLMAVAAASVRTAQAPGAVGARRWIAPAFVAMHLGWGIGFWQGVWQGLVDGVRSRSRAPVPERAGR